MITFDRVTITYAGRAEPVLRDVNFTIAAGELCLVVGATGTGKSTLLGAANGLVPHFTGGTLHGRVTVDGRDTRTSRPRDFADLVGIVTQDPLAGCVTDTLEEELAYGMEQLAIEPSVMRKRIEEVLDVLGLAPFRSRALRDLSAGQLQRAAIGAALTAHPSVLVLDEPTSALDPTAAEEVLSTVTRLVHDLGMTVMMAEHRLERVVQYADRVALVHADGHVEHGDPRATLARATVVPPIVELGRACRWDPLPLSVRDARRDAAPLRAALDGITPPPACAPVSDEPRVGVLKARDVVVRYGRVVALRNVDIDLWAGEIVALTGRNGSGKSSLLWALHGAGPRASGSVTTDGGVGLVPHTPSDVLYLESVGEELAQADREASVEPGTARARLDALVSNVADSTHPRDLSEGQRLALVLAIQLTENPTVVLLDEPTRGLDYDAKHALADILRALAARGHAVMVSTHDVEFVAAATHRVVVLADGEIVADGPTADVVVASPAYAPQVAKILAPLPWLTVSQLARAGAFSLDGATP